MKRITKRNVFTLLFIALAAVLLIWSPKAEYVTRDGLAFGTTYHITYSIVGGKDLSAEIDKALNSVNKSLSMFDKESIIYRVNANDTSVSVDSLFEQVWMKGLEVSVRTNGAFDMTVAPLVNLWGFGVDARTDVTPEEVDSVMRFIGYNMVSVRNGTVIKAYPEIKIDAGAIAKGFGCDVVAAALEAEGCTDYCVEIGGEVAAKGNNPKGDAWRIGINKPIEDSLCVNNEIQEVVALESGGLATSGNYRNYYEEGGKKFSHTINPLTGYPERRSILSATIVASDCMTADAYATACMVLGVEEAVKLIEVLSEIEGYIIYDDNGVMKTWRSASFPVASRD